MIDPLGDFAPLEDVHVRRVRPGELVLPSSIARKYRAGGGYRDAVSGDPLDDAASFPATLLRHDDGKEGRALLLGPAGYFWLISEALVSRPV